MNKKTITLQGAYALLCALLLTTFTPAFSQSTDSLTEEQAMAIWLDSLAKADARIVYQEGKVTPTPFLTLNIPEGYKYIGQEDAQMILTDIWGNPKNDETLGMIVPVTFKLSNPDSWAFIVSYEESGYVSDEDAGKIDYDDLLKEVQDSEAEANEERRKGGYENIHILGWASKPFYDKEKKILHWAKKIRFGEEPTAPEDLTLNYDVRVLGRKGVLSLNAVGVMGQLATINQHIPDVLNIASFNDGYAYKDFNPDIDKVAAYTIGGLIAGKLVAKTGLFLLLLKNIKLVALALIGGLGAFRKKIAGLFRRRKEEEEDSFASGIPPVEPDQPVDATEEQTITGAEEPYKP